MPKGKTVRIWTWIYRVWKFDKGRESLIKRFEETNNEFWLEILENIDVPAFEFKHIMDPEKITASFFVPGFLKDGVPVKEFYCEAGQLAELLLVLLSTPKINSQGMPKEVEDLFKILIF